MFQKIRQRMYNLKNRLYVEGQYLNEANFTIGKNIRYDIDSVNNRLTVRLTDKTTNNRVAQTTVRSGKIVPVIDIRAREVREFFQNNSNIEVSIYKEKIFFTVKKYVDSKVVEFEKVDQTRTIAIPISVFAKAVGYEQLSIYDLFNLSSEESNVKNFSSSLAQKVTSTLKVLSLFSGIGAFEKALEKKCIPFDVVNYCEIDKYTSKAYSAVHNVPETKNLWDVKDVHKEQISLPIDLMTWGFPCTDLSNAGKQKGLIDKSGNVTRSGLYFEGIRILREIKPRFSIIENVKALIGKKFSNEFNMMLKDLKEAGYNNYWACYNASDFGVAQNRERVFIVSIREDCDNEDFSLKSEVQSKTVKLKDVLVDDKIDKHYYVNDEVRANFRERISVNKNTNIISLGQVSNEGSQCGKVYSPQGNFPTLCACTHGYALGYVKIGNLIRRLLPIECGRLMGFQDEDISKCKNLKLSDTRIYKMMGNSIVVNILEYIFEELFGGNKVLLSTI